MRYVHGSTVHGSARVRTFSTTALSIGLLCVSFWGYAAHADSAAELLEIPGVPEVSEVFAVPVNPPHRDYILWYRNYDSPAIRGLVSLALEKTPEYGEFTIIRSRELSQGRALRELAGGNHRLVDIANVATSGERELFLTAIPVPVDGGLLGFRVCVVTPENLPGFKDIYSLADFQNSEIRIGQGAHWPDTSILRENKIEVITHSRYEILFGMLKNDRFECFARGVSEVMHDLEIENDPNLVVEPGLLLAYPMPSYLFVGPEDPLTAHRLQLGLERAIRDDSFGVFLNEYYGAAVEALNLDKRIMIVLDNPFLSGESDNIGRHTLNNLRRRLNLLNH